MSDEQNRQAEEWRHNRLHLRQYSLRLKGLPPTYASRLHEVRTSLHDMLQRANTVPVFGVCTTENSLTTDGRHPYAFVDVRSEGVGNRFIQDMATTRVDRERLTGEWSSISRPRMPAIPHRLQAAGGTDIS